VTNASLFRGVAATGGTVANFSLPGVQDIAGNKLEANRPDFSTQFTILMPTAQLDFGDAPDPVNLVNGRYPTKLVSNGPRHVVGNGPLLGTKIDANLDGLPGVTANRDDVAIAVEHDSASLFATALAGGGLKSPSVHRVVQIQRSGMGIPLPLIWGPLKQRLSLMCWSIIRVPLTKITTQ
jgi:hypothetical protein